MEQITRDRLEAALNVSVEGCPRCKVCDTQIGAAMTVLGPLLERAEKAEAKLASLREALDEADEALGGDSNDAEHDALYSIRELIAGLLGVEGDPPSPADAI